MIGIFIIYNKVDYLFASWHIFRTERGGREIGAIQAINKWTSQRDWKAHAYAKSYLKIKMFAYTQSGTRISARIHRMTKWAMFMITDKSNLRRWDLFWRQLLLLSNEDKLNFDINEHWRTSCNGNPSIETSIIDDSFFRDHPHL